MHDRQCAKQRIAPDIRGLERIERHDVPVGDRVAVRGACGEGKCQDRDGTEPPAKQSRASAFFRFGSAVGRQVGVSRTHGSLPSDGLRRLARVGAYLPL